MKTFVTLTLQSDASILFTQSIYTKEKKNIMKTYNAK